jgi:hypothetical protein
MANALTIDSTWVSEFFAERFLKPALLTEGLFVGGYDIDPLVNKSKTIYVGTRMRGVVQEKTTCGFNPVGTSGLSEVVLNTKPLSVNLEQCAAEFYNTIFKKELKRGTPITDISGTIVAQYMEENALDAIVHDAFAMAWFGDTSIASTATGAFLRPFNGWFTLFENDTNVSKVSIGSTGDYAYEALKTIYESEAGQLIRQTGNPVIKVTPQVYYNLLATFENANTDYGLTKLSDGGGLTFRGIPVTEETTWTESINDYSLNNEKRIFFGNLENLHVGTDIANPGSDAKLFYDELEEKYYFKANFDLGVNYTHSELIVYGRG